MRHDEILRYLIDNHPGTRLLQASGDDFLVHDPSGDLPPERQLPWATIILSDNDYDDVSDLNRPGVFRLNLGLPRDRYRELTLDGTDQTALDVLFGHPVYPGWVCVLNPDRTWPRVRELIIAAHGFAVRKHDNARRPRR